MINEGDYPSPWIRPYGPMWVEIASQPDPAVPRYGFLQINDTTYPTFDTVIAAGFRHDSTGAVNEGPAYEISGRLDVPIGARVLLFMSASLSAWIFDGSGASNTPEPPGTDCQGYGWLLDRDYLIAALKALRVEVFAGEAGGPCECIEAQGDDDADKWRAIYDAGDDNWPLSRMIQLCCGCATLVLDIIPTYPYMTGTLTLTDTCSPGGPSTFDLVFQCHGRNSVLFAAYGPKLCNSTPDPDNPPCDPAFYIQVSCDTCTLVGPECAECRETCDSPVKRIVATGFVGTWAAYNGTWFLNADPEAPCTHTVTCGDITVTAVKTRVGADSVLTVTFSGAAGGTAVFKYTEPASAAIACFSNTVVPWLSGSNPNNPDTITVEPIFCEECPEFCDEGIDWPNMIATVSLPTGDCVAHLPVLTFTDNPTSTSARFSTTGAGGPSQTVISCVNGRVSVVNSAGAFTRVVVSEQRNPFVYVVDATAVVGSPVDPCGVAGAGTFRITFTD